VLPSESYRLPSELIINKELSRSRSPPKYVNYNKIDRERLKNDTNKIKAEYVPPKNYIRDKSHDYVQKSSLSPSIKKNSVSPPKKITTYDANKKFEINNEKYKQYKRITEFKNEYKPNEFRELKPTESKTTSELKFSEYRQIETKQELQKYKNEDKQS